MCLAVPMQVVALRRDDDEAAEPQVAVVERAGIRKEIRLDMVDRIPELGEYVIIHAGFALRTLTADEAEANLELLKTMAARVEEEGPLPGVTDR